MELTFQGAQAETDCIFGANTRHESQTWSIAAQCGNAGGVNKMAFRR